MACSQISSSSEVSRASFTSRPSSNSNWRAERHRWLLLRTGEEAKRPLLTPMYNWVFPVFGEGTGKHGSSLFEVSVRRGNQRCLSPSSETDSPKTRKTQKYAAVDTG